MSELVAQGIEAFNTENYSEAIELFTQAIETDSELTNAYAWRAWAYLKLQDYNQALLESIEATDFYPTSFAYWVRGQVYRELGDFQSALTDLTTAIELSPTDESKYISRAIVWEKLERFDKAVEDYTVALELNPEDANYLQWRAWDYQELGMDAEALADLLRLQEIDPEYADLDDQIQAIQTQLDDEPETDAVTSQNTYFEEAESLETLLQKLDQLTGLPSVKAEVKKLINLVRVQQLRRERGLATPPLSLHLVFTGNPGTGKTTVARLIARIYKSLGLLSRGSLVEVDRSGLVAGFVGQTALKVTEVVERARGGILFIDEAYTLVADSRNSDFGREAIDTLLKAMEDYRDDFVVIVAGYPKQMTEFLSSNPGLQSRFNKYVSFDDYTISELCEILENLCASSGYFLNESASHYVYELIQDLISHSPTAFGNARGVRNLFEQAIAAQASRVVELEQPTEIDLCTLDATDFVDTALVQTL